MPIYTKTGDDGSTGLFGNRRVAKDHARIEAYGTVDELNSVLGLIGSESPPADIGRHLKSVQDILFEIGADLATEGGSASTTRVLSAISEIEHWIDASEDRLPQLTSFVLPGGTRLAALLHVARTVARRAERRYWSLVDELAARKEAAVPGEIGVYLNRLSDLCFSWARLANAEAGVADIPWRRS